MQHGPEANRIRFRRTKLFRPKKPLCSNVEVQEGRRDLFGPRQRIKLTLDDCSTFMLLGRGVSEALSMTMHSAT